MGSASTNVSNNTPTTRQLASGNGSFISGLIDTNNGEVGPIDLGVQNISEFEFCLQIVGADVTAGDTIQLRVENDAGVPFDVYTNIPTITVVEPEIEPLRPVVKQTSLPRHLESRILTPPFPVVGAASVSHAVDAVIFKTLSVTHTVDAVISKTFTVTHSVDAVILKTSTVTHTVSAVIFKSLIVTHTVDAVIEGVVPNFQPLRPTPRPVTNRYFYRPSRISYLPSQTTSVRTHSVDAVILRAANTLTHTVDAEITTVQPQFVPLRPTYKATNFRRYLPSRISYLPARSSSTRQHFVDAVIRVVFSPAYTVTAVIRKAFIVTHTVTAEIGLAYKTKTHQVDAYIYLERPPWPQDTDGDRWPQGDGVRWPEDSDPDTWPQVDGVRWPQDTDSNRW
jgi:hypothetical protein